MADLKNEFTQAGAEVIALSTDSIYSHKRFAETSPLAQKVKYPLLSDRNQQISRSFGVLDEPSGAAYRASIIIDPEGYVVYYSVYPREVGRNVAEILRTLQAVQYGRKTGEGIPAGWQPGEPRIARDWNMVGKI